MDKIGVYFSANDSVYDWAIVFLNSFRKYNPNLKLYLIPFDKNCVRLLQLSNKYNFKAYEDDSFLRLEKIGKLLELGFSSYGPNWFRRYATFWGPLDFFIYLDVRQVILADLNTLLESITSKAFDFVHYDCALDQVYEPGTLRNSFLKKGKGRGFNSGRWASKRGLFSIEELESYANECANNRVSLNPRNTDQAFINYCCDTTENIKIGHFAEICGDHIQNGWARQRGHIYIDSIGNYRLWDYGGLDHKKKLFLLHWAGYSLSPLIPKANLFLKFSNYSLLKKMIFRISTILYLPKLLIRNRYINQFYHKIKDNLFL